MNTPTRLSLFAVALVAAFTAAAGLGRVTGPVGPAAAAAGAHGSTGAGAGLHSADGAGTTTDVTGLSVTEGGYTLDLQTTALPVGQAAPLRLRILGPAGSPLLDYTRTHDKDLHLIVVRRDTQHFQHVHPVRDDAGLWTVPLTLPAAGDYKVFADFTPVGAEQAIALVSEVRAAGDYRPQPLPPVESSTTGGGYTVDLDGVLVAGEASVVTLTVSRDGRPVTDLQPYLAAYGHVVALREGDLAYLHVHPQDDPGTPGPRLTFEVEVPSPGTYRVFLDFQHDGKVRTAPFTVTTKGLSR